MAKAKNSSSAPPPLPPATPPPRGSCVPPATPGPIRPSWEAEQALSQAEGSLRIAEHHCREAIRKGWSVKAMDQARWTGETERWSKVWWPQLEAALAECGQAGMHAGKIRGARTWIKKDWELVCEYRKSLALAPTAMAASVDPFKTGAPGRPTAMHLSYPRRNAELQAARSRLSRVCAKNFPEA